MAATEKIALAEAAGKTAPSRGKRMSVPIIDPAEDFRVVLEARRSDALQEELIIQQQQAALDAQLLAQRKLIAACDQALAALAGNGDV